MTYRIPESDWRQFKRVHAELLERFCARVLEELVAAAKAGDGAAFDRYDGVRALLKKRDKEFRNAFDDYRRSTAESQLFLMRSMGLLTDDDLEGFSEQTQMRIRRFDAIAGSSPDDSLEED